MFEDKSGDNTVTNDEVIQRYYYYPFGAETENTPWKQQPTPNIRYQYNGKEKIDELGLGWNDYGARNYDALLGRWMGVDALSEMYAPVTGYGYVLNNPISLIDPTGMKVENWYENEKTGERVHKTGAEEDAYKNNTNWKDRGSDFEDNGKYYGSDGSTSVLLSEATVTSSSQKQETNWYAPGGKGNFAFGTSASVAENLGTGSFRMTNGAYNGNAFSFKYYASGWSGGSVAKITTRNVAKVGNFLGKASFAIGLAMDVKGVINYSDNPNSPNAVHPVKAGLNTAMGAYGVWLNPIAPTLYFGIDNFYPGGWPAVLKDQDNLYQENRAIDPTWQMIPGAMKQ